ncbi:hypothetical protein [Halegenticoccus tardaugens]|uniref:hypothetical protein n=1 Tax=Halegenticoccus tardaugens TaxID=2071624 RepID=UPI00100B2F76|nr:hypothetical protein [Halegenticoccus tardaugens]
MSVSFTRSAECDGVTVSDAIERRQYTLETDAFETLTPADPDRFRFPVDDAVSIRARTVTLPSVVATYVRDADGAMRAEVAHFDACEFPAGRYSVELCAPIKLYVRADGPLRVSATENRISIELERTDELLVGARSHHERPAATITTTGDPRALMRAVSALGSALKTTTCERSYPTLRGHPPTVELGDAVRVPSELEPPETGVRIEVPPELRYVYPVAPLSYYFGARVEPGPAARLVTDDGFEHSLETPRGFESEAERVLKQAFFLDCLTRTEGYYEVDLHERRAVEGLVDLDFADLYDRPLASQLRAYLDVPYAVVEPHLPEWKLTTHVDPTPENAELLPFLVNDLAVIRLPEGRSISPSEAQMAAIDDFTRDEFTRSAAGASVESPALIQPAEANSIEQAWAGDDAPIGASKASVRAFRNRLGREASDGDIDITVVCNDPAMDEEGDLAAQVYGTRDDLPFDVRIHRNLSTEALRAVVETDGDFLHYIGHIDDAGFECADGRLDARGIDAVGVDAFFLNACSSYEQGMALIDGGAIGGVVTLAEVINSGAVNVGKTMVRLLNQGFPLRAALDIAKDESIVGGHYIVVGDGNLDVVQSDSRTPVLLRVETLGEGYEITPKMYPTSTHGMGTIAGTFNGEPGVHYIASGEVETYAVSATEIRETLSVEELPLLFDGELTWTTDLDTADI